MVSLTVVLVRRLNPVTRRVLLGTVETETLLLKLLTADRRALKKVMRPEAMAVMAAAEISILAIMIQRLPHLMAKAMMKLTPLSMEIRCTR